VRKSKTISKDLVLKRYLELSLQIKRLEGERARLNEKLKEQGTHSTKNFVVLVSNVERIQVPTFKVLVEEFGDRVLEFCKVLNYKVVRVSKKKEG
jgi:hypothetical protein